LGFILQVFSSKVSFKMIVLLFLNVFWRVQAAQVQLGRPWLSSTWFRVVVTTFFTSGR
jgi:hypothetical protein